MGHFDLQLFNFIWTSRLLNWLWNTVVSSNLILSILRYVWLSTNTFLWSLMSLMSLLENKLFKALSHVNTSQMGWGICSLMIETFLQERFPRHSRRLRGSREGGGHSNYSAVHIGARPEKREKKKVVFWGWTRFARIAFMAQNMPIFPKKVFFWILLRGV